VPWVYGSSIGSLEFSVPVELRVISNFDDVLPCDYSNQRAWLGEEKSEMSALNNPVIAVIVSLIISVAYFTMVDHYFMDMQGLDYWYLFRQ
jgi:hypothetical protein